MNTEKKPSVEELQAERDAIEAQNTKNRARLKAISIALLERTAESIMVGNIYQSSPHTRLIVNKIEEDNGEMLVEFYQVSVYNSFHKESNIVKKYITSPSQVMNIEPLNKKAAPEDLALLEECFQAKNRFIQETDDKMLKLCKSGVVDFD